MAVPDSVSIHNLSGTYNLVSAVCLPKAKTVNAEVDQNKQLSDPSDAVLQMVRHPFLQNNNATTVMSSCL
jgi:hypothetical protein